MKVIIIGSKGFIGSHLFTYLSQRKMYDVWGCDVVVDYSATNYFQVDATNANYINIFSNHKFDICINCAGAANVADSLKNPFRDFSLNVQVVFQLLNSIKDYHPTCKFINFSSAAVYGNPSQLPIKETQSLQPISPYGWHKLYAEQICREFHQFYNIKTLSFRVFSAYGIGLKKQLFWDLYKKGKKNNHVKLFGTGRESRDFIHVQDIASVVDLIIQKGTFNGEAINIANGQEYQIEKVATLFYNYFNKDINFGFSGIQHVGYPQNWVADISAIEILGYKHQVSIETGIKAYALWVKDLK